MSALLHCIALLLAVHIATAVQWPWSQMRLFAVNAMEDEEEDQRRGGGGGLRGTEEAGFAQGYALGLAAAGTAGQRQEPTAGGDAAGGGGGAAGAADGGGNAGGEAAEHRPEASLLGGAAAGGQGGGAGGGGNNGGDTPVRSNVCSDGKLLPELYLLGAPRAGVSSLEKDLGGAGVTIACDLADASYASTESQDGSQADGSINAAVMLMINSTHSRRKDCSEWHFFDRWVLWGHAEGEAEERVAWLKNLPACPASKRSVVADFTPAYLRMVPMPPGAEIAPDSMKRHNVEARGFREGSTQLLRIPELLKDFYGTYRSSQLTFLTLLRSPLERMQSHWYAERHLPEPASFEDAVKGALSELEMKPPRYNEWLWTSLYSWGFKHWLHHFEARQFAVALSKDYFTDRRGVCEMLAKRMEFQMNCASQADVQLNTKERPALQQDLSAETRQQIDKVLSEERKRLAGVLAQAQMEGATLYNYNASEFGDEAAIESWLDAGWWAKETPPPPAAQGTAGGGTNQMMVSSDNRTETGSQATAATGDGATAAGPLHNDANGQMNQGNGSSASNNQQQQPSAVQGTSSSGQPQLNQQQQPNQQQPAGQPQPNQQPNQQQPSVQQQQAPQQQLNQQQPNQQQPNQQQPAQQPNQQQPNQQQQPDQQPALPQGQQQAPQQGQQGVPQAQQSGQQPQLQQQQQQQQQV
mmetsp:Transcript_64337/g.153444  ORF Transcript_64337/g.153444 Transcript_64337/m.153444 type:complete len:695 (+) Transcript_64337:128-2212(+)